MVFLKLSTTTITRCFKVWAALGPIPSVGSRSSPHLVKPLWKLISWVPRMTRVYTNVTHHKANTLYKYLPLVPVRWLWDKSHNKTVCVFNYLSIWYEKQNTTLGVNPTTFTFPKTRVVSAGHRLGVELRLNST